MVYQEVIDGCSRSSKGFFVKHLCEIEQIELIRKRLEFTAKYISAGVPTEEERITHLKETGEWSDAQESDILSLRQTISDNERSLHTIIPQQQAAIRKIVEEHRRTLIDLLTQKKSLIGTTAEELAEKDGVFFMTYLSLFSDRECTKPVFASWDEFESLEESEMNEYLQSIDEIFDRLKEQNIRRISALPFFLNAFSYSKEAIHTFLHRPISRLTNYQIHLFSLGTRNLSILSQSEGTCPEYFDKVAADDILKWFDLNYSIIIGKRKQSTYS